MTRHQDVKRPYHEGTSAQEPNHIAPQYPFRPNYSEHKTILICVIIQSLAFYLMTINSACLVAIGSGGYDDKLNRAWFRRDASESARVRTGRGSC